MQEREKKIYTIGHSTYSIEDFITMLKVHNIGILVDIRRHPGSKRYPHFNKEFFEQILKENGIKYQHLEELGGRRRPKADSINTAWRNLSFRGYADYMETMEFKDGIEKLTTLADTKPTVYMCSEAVWWSCHRSLVSDYLKIRDWKVMHIMSKDKLQEHPFTSAAKVSEGQLFISYSNG
ncbi:MAG TPA: DUF488 domain-containing protein [Cytophagaceae bacterium]|jgi:uncharacterized protein (DUF488 family)